MGADHLIRRLRRLANQVPQPVHAPPLVGVLLHIAVERLILELDHAEHQRHGLDQAVLVPADLEGGPGAGGDVAVARAIDHDLGPEHDRPGLRLEDDRGSCRLAVAGCQPLTGSRERTTENSHAAGKRMQQVLNAGFVEQIERHELEDLRIEGNDVACFERGRNRPSGPDQPFQETCSTPRR